jgi:hypothetical protein
VYFRPVDDGIIVLAVMHSRRSQGNGGRVAESSFPLERPGYAGRSPGVFDDRQCSEEIVKWTALLSITY